MDITVKRTPSNDVCTHGDLYIDGQWAMYSLEDPVRDVKVKGKTAIPPGHYKVIVTHSPRFKKLLPLLLDVPNFTGVRIHPGNSADHTEGCLLVGNKREGDKILESRDAFEDLMVEIEAALQNGEEVWITIEDERFAYG